jgi:glycolate dehydrogenase FAD-binding subunit
MARRAVRAATLRVIVARQLTSTDEVAACIREARESSTSLRIVGRGHWLDAGRECRANEPLSLGALDGVTEYEPGDLVLTARAGTSLAEIARVTAREKQWLTLDPFGSPDGSIGATIATASSGPLASAFGAPRDHLLGCEMVTGNGDVVRAGGRVVKNVAGFDLARLMTGAWGTLGAITEVTVRLRAKPEVDRTLAVAIEPSAEDVASRAWRWLRASPFTPLAAELCSAALARRIGAGDATVLLLRLGGNAALVQAAERSVAELGDSQPVDANVWDGLRESEPAGSAVVRLSDLPTRVGELWSAASSAAERGGGFAHSTLERGVVRCVVPVEQMEEENGRLRGMIAELQSAGSRIAERLPRSIWDRFPSPAADPLSREIRRAFDPLLLLNPGILGELA